MSLSKIRCARRELQRSIERRLQIAQCSRRNLTTNEATDQWVCVSLIRQRFQRRFHHGSRRTRCCCHEPQADRAAVVVLRRLSSNVEVAIPKAARLAVSRAVSYRPASAWRAAHATAQGCLDFSRSRAECRLLGHGLDDAPRLCRLSGSLALLVSAVVYACGRG